MIATSEIVHVKQIVHIRLLFIVVSLTVTLLKWIETKIPDIDLKPARQSQPLPLVLSLLYESPNSTCLASLKQIQEELKMRTQITCGLDKISSEKECHQRGNFNTQFYSQNGSIKRLEQCENYFKIFKTRAEKPVSMVERQFPLAFSIMVHDQLPLLETMIALLFRPHNSYCIFVDKKAPTEFHNLVRKMVNCYKFKFPKANIFLVEDNHPIYWAHISMLMADIKCLDLLLKSDSTWQYYINQPGTALPTMKVEEISKILHQHKGPCNTFSYLSHDICQKDSIYSIRSSTFDERWQYEFVLSKSNNPFEYYPDVAHKTSKRISKPPPYNLTIYKGHKDVALTRSSAEFFLRSQLGIDFLEWLKSGVGFPEEFFFATLVRVSQKLFYQEGIVVQNTDDDFDSEGLCFRYSVWHPVRDSLKCSGKVLRYMCHFGLGDLPNVFFNQSCTFANKFDLNVPNGREAVACIHNHLTS